MDRRQRDLVREAAKAVPSAAVSIDTAKRGHPRLLLAWPCGKVLSVPCSASPSDPNAVRAAVRQLRKYLTPDGMPLEGCLWLKEARP
jgi:hypothetical protein